MKRTRIHDLVTERITSFTMITTKNNSGITTLFNSITECPEMTDLMAQFGTKQACFKTEISSGSTIMKNEADIITVIP